MKIDIITLHAVPNYGSVLQALATQEIFKLHGCDVTIINYVRENVRQENLLKTWSKGNPIKALIMYPTIQRWKTVFSKYCIEHLNLSNRIYTTEEDFKTYPLNADAYCTGSDQVWNSKWNRGIILPLYLSFVPKNKFKFTYSASFGQSQLNKEEISATQEYIKQYRFISVREDTGKDIIENQYHYPNAIHIVDPTIAMTPEFWRNYSSPRKIQDDYILIYNLNRSKEFDNYANQLSKKTGLKLVRLCTRYDQFYRCGKSILVPEIPDFISLIDNAKYVLTDSFHATAFSMNLNTEPICVYPKDFSSRIESFLSLTNSLQRHVINYNDFDVINRKTNFDEVNRILDKERIKVNHFIDNVLMAIKQDKGVINE